MRMTIAAPARSRATMLRLLGYAPNQCVNGVHLLPFGDTRYKFFLFPINYAVLLDRHVRAHSRIAPFWRQMSHAALQQQVGAAPRFPCDREQALAVFDEQFYLETNAGVAAVALNHGTGFALAHYTRHGFQERRLPIRLGLVCQRVSVSGVRGRPRRLCQVGAPFHGGREGAWLPPVFAEQGILTWV